MIEYLIDHMEQTSVQRITGLLRRKVYKRLESVGQALSAAIIYEQIRLWYEFDLAELSKEFYTDTHAFCHDHSRSRPFLCRFRRNGTNWHDRHRCRWNGRAETMAMKKD